MLEGLSDVFLLCLEFVFESHKARVLRTGGVWGSSVFILYDYSC